RVEDLKPNPTADIATLTLSTEENLLEIQVDVVTTSGTEVMQVYNGVLGDGWLLNLDIPVANLSPGVYQVRIQAKNFVTSKKLLVTQ
ncbi:MAG: T9SS type A sorting domain-containing protein, partial [Bacteroidota bacterium]|nr:T9SS type A sorting domain-containing protein [Bacteroidota bacterium]